MRLRPCIDIHDGKVKQIVGSSLKDSPGQTAENFVSEYDALHYARLYHDLGLTGGHIIILNMKGTPEYDQSLSEAMSVLREYPGKWQIGGGITADTAEAFLSAGASHVIVTSFVFRDGHIDGDRLSELVRVCGREHITLDLSCKRLTSGGPYMIMTDRWHRATDTPVTPATLDDLARSCSEFLVHAVDAEGKRSGIEPDIARILGEWAGIPITYAGGVRDLSDLSALHEYGRGRLDVTIGSALDIFGGDLSLNAVLKSLCTP